MPPIDGSLLAQRFTAVRCANRFRSPWCVAGISAGLPQEGAKYNNGQSAESAQTVLIKTAQATPETDREPAFGERWGVTTSSSSKHENFGAELCVRWRQLDRGMPGGGSEVPGLHVEPPIPGPAKARCGCSEEAWLVPLTSTLSAKPLRTPSLSGYKR